MKTGKYTNTIIALIAAFVAILALGVSIWDGVEQRQHNRLSVKPLLSFGWESYDDDRSGKFFVQNVGVGPAVIKKYNVSLDGEDWGEWKWDHFDSLHEKIGIPGEVKPDSTSLGPRVPVGVGDVLRLYWYESDVVVDVKYHDALNTRLRFEIFYCSVYEECWWLTYGRAR